MQLDWQSPEFIRPSGRGLTNAQRCAEAVYHHFVRHGISMEVPQIRFAEESVQRMANSIP